LKILLINDVHLTNENRHPASCTSSYTDDLFDLLYQANEVAKEIGATAIVQLGDLFHIKAPSANSHALVRRTTEWAKAAPCPVFVVPGNHDLSHDRLDSLDEGQPLGVLYSAGVVTRAEGYLWAKNDEDPYPILPIYGVPWQMHWDASEELADESVRNALRGFTPKDTPQLIVTHAPFFEPGKESPYESYSTQRFSRIVQERGTGNIQVSYGHIHNSHGQYVVNGVRFCNYGALSRGSLTEDNMQRTVGVTVWDSVTGRFEFKPLHAKPAEEVFRVVEVTEKKTKQLELDEFLSSVGQSKIEITSIESVMAKVREMQLGKDIERIVEELLTSV
jgi:DNA repair exonuclease SbcCD nuclease subunit